jgi:hypothetical protein
LKDKYVSRSVEDSGDRKKKKSFQNKREFDNRMHKQRSRGAAKAGSEIIKTKIEEVCSGATGRGQIPRPKA